MGPQDPEVTAKGPAFALSQVFRLLSQVYRVDLGQAARPQQGGVVDRPADQVRLVVTAGGPRWSHCLLWVAHERDADKVFSHMIARRDRSPRLQPWLGEPQG